jgi:hypothetical protein
MSRAIRHTGRILIDLIPHVYSGERIIRVLGEDGKPQNVQLGKQYVKTDPKTGQPVTTDGHPPADDMSNVVLALHDFSAGKYDLTVTTGPSFTTRREEAAYQMTEMIRAFPQSAPIIGPELAKNLDWPGADTIAEKLEQVTSGQPSPEIQQVIEQGKQQIEQLTQENQQLKADSANEAAKIESDKQQQMLKLASQEQIEREKIASNERIAQMKIESEARLAAFKVKLMAENQPPQTAQAA